MKAFFFVLLSSLLFHATSFAIEQRELAEAWMNARYTDCGEAFLMQIETRNAASLELARKGVCAQYDKANMEKNRECLKTLNKNLQIFLDKVPNAAENQGCRANPKFAEYLDGNTQALKPADPVYSASVSCTPTDSKTFKWQSADNKPVCTNKYTCKTKFKFGESTLEPGTYFLRCNDKATSQADCDQMNFYECEGKEVSYAKVSYGGLMKADSVRVTPSKAPAAQ